MSGYKNIWPLPPTNCKFNIINMENTAIIKLQITQPGLPGTIKNNINSYYSQAGPDYETWSKAFNMHYGYWKPGMNPFKREKMLNQMTLEVFQRLGINAASEAEILDMGCGVGGSMRYLTRQYNHLKLKGITIVPWQINKGRSLAEKAGLSSQIEFIEGDFTNSPFKSGSLDGIYAIESACHAPGDDKKDFIEEAFRLLKPGCKLVIADGFIKNPHILFSGFTKRSYETLCTSWALPEMGQLESFLERLKSTGFKAITVSDISWKVAPSVAHSPFLILKFLLQKIWRGEKIGKESLNNLKGVWLTNILGLKRKKFSYYIITAEK